MSRLGSLRIGLVVWILAACGSPQDDSSGTAEAIRRTNQEYVELLPKGSVDDLMSLYTQDVLLMPPGASSAQGLDEVRTFWSDFFDEWEVVDATSTIDEVIVGEGWAWSRGHYLETLRSKDGLVTVVESGKFSGIWRRVPDGSWKISRDMWNASNTPDPGSEP